MKPKILAVASQPYPTHLFVCSFLFFELVFELIFWICTHYSHALNGAHHVFVNIPLNNLFTPLLKIVVRLTGSFTSATCSYLFVISSGIAKYILDF
ncbi:hypothetical protein HanIR_Chr14g0671431 [Helianthus annuus]|nr:hypothetical protein HanIR_Chr14g0671431 [Helianthus annuus]